MQTSNISSSEPGLEGSWVSLQLVAQEAHIMFLDELVDFPHSFACRVGYDIPEFILVMLGYAVPHHLGQFAAQVIVRFLDSQNDVAGFH